MYEKDGFVFYDSGSFEGYIRKYTGYEKDIIIPEGTKGIESLSEYRYEYKLDVDSIYIPKSVERICSLRFLNVKKVVICGDNVYLDEFVFEGCKELSSLELKGKNYHFEKGALYGCDSLANKNGLIIYGNVLYGCINEGPVITIPDGIEIISDRALFIQKRNKNVFTEYDLKEVILPDSVKDIHLNAFINSNDADPDFGTGESLSSMISRKMPKKMNIPKGYLKQSKGSFDATMALYLLEGPWKALGTKEDYGCLILNQHSKKLTEFCYKELKDKDIFDFLLEIQCKYNYKTGLCAIAEWACNNKKLISGTQIESLKNMICLAKDKKAQKIIDKV